MTEVLRDVSRRYASALKAYLTGRAESSLEEAYEIGRAALEGGLGVLDMAAVHQLAVAALLAERPPEEAAPKLAELASAFFTESLASYEMAQRGYQEANAALKALNETLESRVRARTAELAASEARYRTLVDGVDAVVWEADPERRKFSFVSHRVESLFGFPVADWTDAEGTWEGLVHREDVEAVRARTREALATHADHVVEYRLKTGDGRWLWLRDVVRVEVDAAGKPRALSGVMIDVTELVALQQYRENLIDVISHEFRTPITIIQGYAQLLATAEHKLSREQAANASERIGESTRHLSYLLGTIAELARMRDGGVPVHREKVPTRALIDEAVALMTARGRGLEASVRIEVASPLEELTLDRRKLLISLVELLDNAAKFSPKGSPIFVRVKAEGGDVVISVEDKGPGVPQNVQRRMFQPFSQGDMTSVRKVGGAGLGLAVVAGLVRSQGGRVEVQSRPGEGAVFRVVLPRAGS